MMLDQKARKKLDTKEFELPDTVFSRTIEDRVFQTIILKCLSKIVGIGLVGGNFIDSLLGREGLEAIRGITVEQDNKHQSVAAKLEVNVAYGIPIPEKAEEIQSKVSEEITNLTGLHVASVHVIFKGILSSDSKKEDQQVYSAYSPVLNTQTIQERYNDEF